MSKTQTGPAHVAPLLAMVTMHNDLDTIGGYRSLVSVAWVYEHTQLGDRSQALEVIEGLANHASTLYASCWAYARPAADRLKEIRRVFVLNHADLLGTETVANLLDPRGDVHKEPTRAPSDYHSARSPTAAGNMPSRMEAEQDTVGHA